MPIDRMEKTCERLWHAVLKQAIKDARWDVTARAWFRSKDQGAGSFLWICTLLDLSPESIRRLLANKREHERKPFPMVIDYSTDGRLYKDFIKDISAGGVFIETHMPFSVGHEVSLSFPLPRYQKYIKIAGEVVRIAAQGIGVKFKVANQDQEVTIESLLETI